MNKNNYLTKKLAILALMMALYIALGYIKIPVSDNTNIFVTFLVAMTIAAYFPLIDCLIWACLTDLVGFIIHPTGAFFIGYTITPMVAILIYHLFFKKDVTFIRITLSKIVVAIIVNIFLNQLWTFILYNTKGNTYWYYVVKAFYKNLIVIPIDIVVYWLFYKAIKPLRDSYLKPFKK